MEILKRRVGVLISGNGSNLQALIDACSDPEYPAQIVVVISNKSDAYGVVRAREAGIPAHVVSHKDYSNREQFDAAMMHVLDSYFVEIVCLAGFMRLLSAPFVEHWKGRMINIHPSLLPAFKGGHAIADALEAGATVTGCTVHHVISEVDAGPVIVQAEVPIFPEDTAETLASRIHMQEHRIYPQALKALAQEISD